MRDQSIPEDWSVGTSRTGDANSQFPKSQPGTPGSQHPEETGNASKRRLQRNINSDALSQTPSELPNQVNSSHQPLIQDGLGAGSPPLPPKFEPSGSANSNHRQWWKNWMLWAGLAGLCSSSVAAIAVAVLLKLPSAPNCPSIFWPLASGTLRLHCAQVAANKQTVPDLMEAIALVQALPDTHPLRPEIKRYLEQWSLEILALADEQFQEGNLQEAIAIAKKIPADISTASVQQNISKWQSIWSEAESIYAAAAAELPKQNWHKAFMTAVRLLNVGNNYWATAKYEEVKNLIETARDDGNKLLKAEDLADRGNLANLLKALELAGSVGKSSYMYQKAQDMVPELGRKILELAQTTLERKDADEAIAIANQIPAIAQLELEVQDFVTIAEAKRSAWVGTIPSLETAISTVQKIGTDRPFYDQAQELVSRWQLEIEDVGHLERARELAQPGTVPDLTAAIAEASLIPDTNPRTSEAKQEINRWRQQVETFEDQPILDRAEGVALAGDVTALQAAINEASQITEGRALYRKARRRIRAWTNKVETIQDQPYLDQARELASNGNLPAAIAAAQQIQPGRALSGEAQAAINDWQGQIQARQNWREAQQVAQQGTADALSKAIRLADRVPVTSPLRVDVNSVINEWGQQLLQFAQQRGTYDIPGGIVIAQEIPRSSDAYRAAQEQIAAWKKILNPPPLEPSPNPNQINPEPNTNLNPEN